MKSRIIFFSLVFIIFAIIFLVWLNFSYSGSNGGQLPVGFTQISTQSAFSEQNTQTQEQESLMPSLLNGLPIPASRAQLPVLAVMIENSPPARFQSGLGAADVIYETLAEGGITRFMALFQSKDVDTVGPVRSVRTYFVEIAREYDAWLVHVGGNVDALPLIKKYGLHDLDQFYLDKPFWRDPIRLKTRGLEHSMYTDTVQLRLLTEGDLPSDFVPWLFTAQEPPVAERPKSQKVSIDFSFPAFKAQWDYDAVSNSYLRTTGGIVHRDASDGSILSAKNIIVQFVDMALLPDRSKGPVGVLSIGLIGSGKGFLFRDGKAFPVTWSKSASGERTRYLDENGKEIFLEPGVTWIELAGEKMLSYQ